MEDPQQYEESKHSVDSPADEYLSSAVSRMKWGVSELLLDYGCGPGSLGAKHLFPLIEANGSKMLCVDISAEMITYARNKYPHSRVTYVVGDIMDEQQSPFPDETKFDKIFLTSVLQYIKDYTKAVERFFYHLKIEGQCAFSIVLQSPIFEIHVALGKSTKWLPFLKGILESEIIPDWISRGSQGVELELEAVFSKAGFEINYLNKTSQKHLFKNIGFLVEFYCSCNRFTKKIPKELLAEFKSELEELLLPFCSCVPDSDSLFIHHYLLQGLVVKPNKQLLL